MIACELTPESEAAANMTGNLEGLLDDLQNWNTPAERLRRAKTLAAQANALAAYLEVITPAEDAAAD